jgi:hypothetical protein
VTAISTRLLVRPEPAGRVLRLYLGTAFGAIVGFYALPRDSLLQDTVYYPLLGLLSVAAIVAGVAWHRPRRRLPWLLLAAGQLLFVLGDVVYGLDQHVFETAPFPARPTGSTSPATRSSAGLYCSSASARAGATGPA